MSKTDPCVRAPLTKAVLELLELQPPHVTAAVRTRAEAAVLQTEAATRVSWIPLGTQLSILRALRDEIGSQGYDEFCARHLSSTIEQPLVKGVFDTTVRLFGVGPGPVYRMFPRAWAMMSRGCGVVSAEGTTDPPGTRLRVTALPVDEEEIDLFVSGFRATFQGVLDLFELDGKVTMEDFDRPARTATYLAQWRSE
jgi:hypothetical protein